MIQAAAIDDEPLALEILTDYCSRCREPISVRTFTSTALAAEFLSQGNVRLLFLDIQMPSMDGLTFYNRLPQKPNLIFTTAHPQFALEGFDLGAHDYLLKPIRFERFEEAVERVAARVNKSVTRSRELLLRASYGILQLDLDQILFVESFGDHLHIHLATGKMHEIRMPLKELLTKLPEEEFVRIHRSYCVAKNKIEFVRNQMVFIGGKTLPIGRKFDSPL